MIRVEVTTSTGEYPVGARYGFRSLVDAVAILGEGTFKVLGQPPSPEEIAAANEAAKQAARDRRLIRGFEYDPFMALLEAAPSAEEMVQMQATVDAVADVPPRVEAVETALTGKADASAVTALAVQVDGAPLIATTFAGVDPTGATNSGAGLQAFLNDLSSTKRPGIIPPGKYRVGRRLDIGSNTSLSMYGAIFEQYNAALGNGSVTEGVFHIFNAHHVTLHGGEIDGRKSHIAGVTEYKHGVSIIGDCDHITIRDMVSNRNKGDGFYVGRSKLDAVPYPVPRNISIERCIADSNHRQGMSITHGRDISVSDSEFTKTAGTAPQAGLDIESNNADETIFNVTFTRCSFRGNATNGAIVMGIHHRVGLQERITFRDCDFRENVQHGIYVHSGRDVVFEGCHADNNGITGMIVSRDVSRLQYVGGRVTGNTSHGVSVNPTNAASRLEGLILDGVLIEQNSRGVSVAMETGTMDGLIVRRCTIGDPYAPESQDRGFRSFVTGGTCRNIMLVDNEFGNATTNAVEFNSGDDAATRTIRDNKGYTAP